MDNAAENKKLVMQLQSAPWKNPVVVKYTNRNMSKSKGWTLQSSLLMLWMDENLNQQSNKNC